MADVVTINPLEVETYQGTVEPAEAWLFSSKTYSAPNGKRVIAGDIFGDKKFHRKVTVTRNSIGKITVGSFSGDNAVEVTRVDNRNIGGTLSLYLVDEDGNWLATLFTGIRIPNHFETAMDWEDLEAYSRAPMLPYKPTYVTEDRLLVRLNGLQLAGKATDVEYGTVTVSKIPDDLSAPNAVGSNEASHVAALQNLYLDDFASLEIASSSIARSDDYKLVAAVDEEVENDLTTPANMHIQLEAGAKINPEVGARVEIGNLSNPPNRQLFGGLGAVTLGRVLTPEIKLTHWLGTDQTITDGTLVKNAFERAFESIQNHGGGEIILPLCVWTSDPNDGDDNDAGVLDVPNNTTIRGVAGDSNGASGSVLKINTNASHLFRITQNARNIRFIDFTIDLSDTPDSRGILIQDTGSQGTIGDVSFDYISFYNGLIGFDIDPVTEEGLDVHLLSFYKCKFIGQSEAGVKINTNNSAVKIDACSFGVAAEADSIKLMSVGGIDITNNMLLGNGSLLCSGGLPNTGRPRSGIYIGGGHGNIRIVNNQSEGLQFFLMNDADAPGTIKISDNLILSRIQLEENCTIVFEDNDTVAQVFRYGAGATSPRIINRGGNTYIAPEGTPINDCLDEINPGTLEVTRTGFICPDFGDAADTSKPRLDLSNPTDNQIGLRIGNDDFYYDFLRRASDGALMVSGNQTNFEQIEFNGYFTATRFQPSKTVVAAGTTTVQTINKQTGRINIAAGESSKVLNNNLVTANSAVHATVMTNDATAKSVQAVAGAGTITFYPNANPTGEIKVSFWVVT